MVSLIDLFYSTTTKKYGLRKKDNKCIFCGNPLSGDQYCNCRKSGRVNFVYKKLNKKVSYLVEYENDKDALKLQVLKAAIPQKYKGLDFTDFETSSPKQEIALNAVNDYADNAINAFLSGQNLLLIGNYGTGKTMLMSILCEELIFKYRFDCKYFNAVDLLYRLKETFNPKSIKTSNDIIKEYREPDFLFIDDIDKVNPTDYVKEVMYGVINYRYEKSLPTIISANSPIEILDSKYFGEAIISRLIENSKEVKFDFNDVRIV